MSKCYLPDTSLFQVDPIQFSGRHVNQSPQRSTISQSVFHTNVFFSNLVAWVTMCRTISYNDH